MSRLAKFTFIYGVLTLLSLSSQLASAEALFTDGFESNDLSHSEGGVSYGASESASVSDALPRTGNYSLRFRYSAAASGQDSFSEQRVGYSNTSELWIKYDLFIPANYNHRNDTGPDNNKFLAIYRNPYRTPGFQVNWSLSPNGSGGSNINLHRYRNGEEQSTISPAGGIGNDFITSADHGNWIQIIARVKVPSSSSANDGIMQMWKGTWNGSAWSHTQVTNETTLDCYGGDNENYMSELYLLGWSNSGYTEETIFYIDNVEINDAPFYIPKSPPVVN